MSDAENDTDNNNAMVTDPSASAWQTINRTKRPRPSSPLHNNNNNNNKKLIIEQLNTANRFSVLEDNELTLPGEERESQIPKPPPIYIPDVNNIERMTLLFSTVIPDNDFNYKCLKDNEIRVMVNKVDSYRKLIKYLDVSKINYHTFQLKQERAFRVAIKGIHHTTPTESIKFALNSIGHQVRNILNVKSKKNKEPLSMFFVDLEPAANNKNIYEIKSIENAIVKVEPIKKTIELVQCFRCQEFGHTRTYCRKEFRCVKCALNHLKIVLMIQ